MKIFLKAFWYLLLFFGGFLAGKLISEKYLAERLLRKRISDIKNKVIEVIFKE